MGKHIHFKHFNGIATQWLSGCQVRSARPGDDATQRRRDDPDTRVNWRTLVRRASLFSLEYPCGHSIKRRDDDAVMRRSSSCCTPDEDNPHPLVRNRLRRKRLYIYIRTAAAQRNAPNRFARPQNTHRATPGNMRMMGKPAQNIYIYIWRCRNMMHASRAAMC